jgi:hypothetical protein
MTPADIKTLKALIKTAVGKGPPANDYEYGYRRGLRDAEMFVSRLIKNWRFENGEWIEPS